MPDSPLYVVARWGLLFGAFLSLVLGAFLCRRVGTKLHSSDGSSGVLALRAVGCGFLWGLAVAGFGIAGMLVPQSLVSTTDAGLGSNELFGMVGFAALGVILIPVGFVIVRVIQRGPSD